MNKISFTILLAVTGIIVVTPISATNETLSSVASILAEGYDSDKQTFNDNSCLIPSTVSYIGNRSAIIALGDSQSYDTILNQLSLNTSGSLNIGVFSASADSTYAHDIKDDQYTESYYYSEAVHLPTIRYVQPNLVKIV